MLWLMQRRKPDSLSAPYRRQTALLASLLALLLATLLQPVPSRWHDAMAIAISQPASLPDDGACPAETTCIGDNETAPEALVLAALVPAGMILRNPAAMALPPASPGRKVPPGRRPPRR